MSDRKLGAGWFDESENPSPNTPEQRHSAALTVADKLPRENVRDVLESLGLAEPTPVKRFSLRECFGALTMLGGKS